MSSSASTVPLTVFAVSLGVWLGALLPADELYGSWKIYPFGAFLLYLLSTYVPLAGLAAAVSVSSRDNVKYLTFALVIALLSAYTPTRGEWPPRACEWPTAPIYSCPGEGPSTFFDLTYAPGFNYTRGPASSPALTYWAFSAAIRFWVVFVVSAVAVSVGALVLNRIFDMCYERHERRYHRIDSGPEDGRLDDPELSLEEQAESLGKGGLGAEMGYTASAIASHVVGPESEKV